MDHFYDETVAEVSTPVVTPVASIIEPQEQKLEMAPPAPPPAVDNTLDNLIDDEGLFIYKNFNALYKRPFSVIVTVTVFDAVFTGSNLSRRKFFYI